MRRVTCFMRNTGCHSFNGTLAPPIASPHNWSQQCAVPSTSFCCKKQLIMFHTSRISSIRTRTGKNLAILLNKDTFLPIAVKYPIIEESTSKNTWSLTVLVFCGHLRRPPTSAPKTVTVCSVHLHNVVAKKRDAATSLLQRLYARVKLLDVDFVGGDFNMALKGSVAVVFSDAEFMGPGSTPLWGAGGLVRDDTDCTGFL